MKTNELFPISVKAVGEGGEFEAAGSMLMERDLGGDIVRFGAFRKSIADAEARKQALGLKFLWPFLYQHDRTIPIGGITGAAEEGKMLRIKGVVDTEDADGAKAYHKMKAGTATGISYGYDVVSGQREGDVYWLNEVRVHEFSLVTLPMNEYARVISVKAAVPFQNLPLADPETEWDAAAARKRLVEFCGGDEMDWKAYRKAHLWYDKDNAEVAGSYKFPIADVIDGELKAVPKAIFAAAGRLRSADIPDDEKDAMRAHLARYYSKLDRPVPWEAKDDEAHVLAVVDLATSMPELSEEALMSLDVKAVERAAERVLSLRDLAVKAAATDLKVPSGAHTEGGPTFADLLSAMKRLAAN